jgi:hypothetical protein
VVCKAAMLALGLGHQPIHSAPAPELVARSALPISYRNRPQGCGEIHQILRVAMGMDVAEWRISVSAARLSSERNVRSRRRPDGTESFPTDP